MLVQNYKQIMFLLLMLLNLCLLNVHAVDSIKFWIITDTHMDFLYSTDASPENNCRESNLSTSNGSKSGYFGDYRCETPPSLLNSSLDAMKMLHPKPDFILWLGDSIHHEKKYKTKLKRNQIYENIKKVLFEIKNRFENVEIYPALGNHDNTPSQLMPSNDTKLYEDYLIKSDFNSVINSSDASKTFLKGGYYTLLLKPGLRLISLNTILWLGVNKLSRNIDDPASQFHWLEIQFENAEAKHEKVIIMAHTPPGFYNFDINHFNKPYLYPQFNKRFLDLVTKYSYIISCQLYSHSHGNSLFIQDLNGKPASIAVTTSSISPNFGTNPVIKLVAINSKKFYLEKYISYRMNLTLANEKFSINGTNNPKELWELLMDTSSATDGYGLENLTLPSVINFYNKLLSDETVFKKFVNEFHGGHVINITQYSYVKNACAMKYSRISEFDNCFQSLRNESDHHKIYEKLKFDSSDGKYHDDSNKVIIAVSVTLSILVLVVVPVIYFITQRFVQKKNYTLIF